MINNPEPSTKLTDEQTKQLQVFYTRLTNLQTETSIATKNLEMLREETIKVSLEKKYTEDTLRDLREKLDQAAKEVDEHVKLVVKSQEELVSHREERGKTDKHHSSKQKELAAREEEVVKSENMLKSLQEDLSHTSKMLSAERLEVDKAKEAFLHATESVVWK